MNPLVKRLEDQLIAIEDYMKAVAADLFDKEMPSLTEEKFRLFETTGNRNIYEADYFARRRFLALFGVIAIKLETEGLDHIGILSKQQVLCKLQAVLEAICKEECWAVPAHVNRTSNPDWRNTVDLFASETAEAMAHIIDVIGAHLEQNCVAQVKQNIEKRILSPFFDRPVGSFFWEQGSTNWNAVCNGCILSACLHLWDGSAAMDHEKVERICNNFTYFVDGYADDGTCMEGIAYYDYGMTYFVHAAQELYDKSLGEIDLLTGDWDKYSRGCDDKRTRMAMWLRRCYFHSGRNVSFSDGESNTGYRLGLISALALRFPGVSIPEGARIKTFEEDHCARFLPFYMDYFYTKRYVDFLKANKDTVGAQTAGVSSAEAFVVLPDAQWCIANAANGVGMACKGGHNGEPHNHNDIGSFMYVVGKHVLLDDLGCGEYTKDYFSTNRYKIFCNSSFGHNVPIVAGQGQQAGRGYEASAFTAEQTENVGVVHIGMERAYPEGLLYALNRTLQFDLRDGTLTLTDNFEKNENTIITENLVTRYAPTITEDGLIITAGDARCSLSFYADGKRLPMDRVRISTEIHRNHWAVDETVYVIQWDVTCEASVIVEAIK